MTGQEHYEEAERLLEGASNLGQRQMSQGADESIVLDSMRNVALLAQVHATLALAAFSRSNL